MDRHQIPASYLGRPRGLLDIDTQIAEITFTAFEGTRYAITARLIVRRIKGINPNAGNGQDELFPTYRYHAVLTDSPFVLVQAEAQHRGHAIIEQVNADLISGPLADMPSGDFHANGAWLACAAIAHKPDPRRRPPRVPPLRQGSRGHHPHPDHQRAGTPRPPCPYHPTAPARTLAMATWLGNAVRRRSRITGLTVHNRHELRSRPANTRSPEPNHTAEAGTATGRSTTPTIRPRSRVARQRTDNDSAEPSRWIEAQVTRYAVAGRRALARRSARPPTCARRPDATD